MGRRQGKRNVPGTDLFSFLNIMAATIGVQTLLIVISALQIKPGVQAIQLLPAGGAGKGKEANYILCEGGGTVEVIGQGQRRTWKVKDQELDQFLDDVAKKSRPQYLVIGVRPTAFRDFEIIRSKAEVRRLSIGYEPLEAGLRVQLPAGGAPVQEDR